MRHEIEGNVDSVTFDSVTELMEAPRDGVNADHIANQLRTASWLRDYHWTGEFGKSPDPARAIAEAAQGGWAEGADKLRSMMASMPGLANLERAPVERVRRKRRRADQGMEVDVTRYWSGEPATAWTAMVKEPRTANMHRPVFLLINTSLSAGTPCDQLMWRGAVALRLYEELIRLRCPVRVVIGSISSGLMVHGSRIGVDTVVVKDYGETLSVAKLAAMTHAAFHRTWMFTAMCHRSRVSSYLGFPLIAEDHYPPTARREAERYGARLVTVRCALSSQAAEREYRELSAKLGGTAS